MNRPTLLTALLLVLSGCDTGANLVGAATQAGERGEVAAPAKAEAGHIVGRVLDTRGQPLAGAEILVENAMLYARYLHGTSNAEGHYRVPVAPGVWSTQASITRDYNGRRYTLELQPDSSDTFDGNGGVRDFTWKLEGRMPGSAGYGYYGGFVQLSTAFGFHDDLGQVELTFTPDGPLIDGSSGQPLRLRMNDHYWVDAYQIQDIPIGRYIVTATLNEAGTERPLRIADWHQQGAGGNAEPQSRFLLDFLPNPPGGTRNSASIVIGH
ncbi:MAG: carboxypeptidase-like regulatory domain-containing protein [Pseudoxanthomonas suwonensis]|nr:carboxypeptidase-like regulatory domain-containing protein [Pseudoxanthomonas suwonensis]